MRQMKKDVDKDRKSSVEGKGCGSEVLEERFYKNEDREIIVKK